MHIYREFTKRDWYVWIRLYRQIVLRKSTWLIGPFLTFDVRFDFILSLREVHFLSPILTTLTQIQNNICSFSFIIFPFFTTILNLWVLTVLSLSFCRGWRCPVGNLRGIESRGCRRTLKELICLGNGRIKVGRGRRHPWKVGVSRRKYPRQVCRTDPPILFWAAEETSFIPLFLCLHLLPCSWYQFVWILKKDGLDLFQDHTNSKPI